MYIEFDYRESSSNIQCHICGDDSAYAVYNRRGLDMYCDPKYHICVNCYDYCKSCSIIEEMILETRHE